MAIHLATANVLLATQVMVTPLTSVFHARLSALSALMTERKGTKIGAPSATQVASSTLQNRHAWIRAVLASIKLIQTLVTVAQSLAWIVLVINTIAFSATQLKTSLPFSRRP